MPRLLLILAIFVLSMLAASRAHAQWLTAEWVERSQAEIDEIRKAPLRIIVIDKRGNPTPGATVRITQRRHAFPFGVTLNDTIMKQAPAAKEHAAAPVWRALNAASLDVLGQWRLTQPSADRWRFKHVDDAITFAEGRNMAIRYGGAVTADRARMPDFATNLKPDDLAAAMERHTRAVLARFGRRVDQFDLLTHAVDHPDTINRLGASFYRELYGLPETVIPGHPPAPRLGRAAVRFDDAFTGARLQRATRHITHVREAFIAVDAIAVQARLSGTVVEAPIRRSLKWLASSDLPVMIVGLEVGGASDAAAALNLETALRAMFASDTVHGIWFAGLHPADLQDPSAALFDAEGQPTRSGNVLDFLVRELWWSNETGTTDEIGNIQRRVFAGLHRVTATLPDGSTAATEVFLPAGGEEKLVILQPTIVKRQLEPLTPLTVPTGLVDDVNDGRGDVNDEDDVTPTTNAVIER